MRSGNFGIGLNLVRDERVSTPRIAAEVGQAHEGSLSLALSMVDAIAESGADIAKFQVHIPEAESSFDEPFRDPRTATDKSRFDYWKRTGFSRRQWETIFEHTRATGLQPVCSTFSTEGLRWLADAGVETVKIGSAEALWFSFIEKACEIAQEIIVSTGMSSWDEIERAIEIAKNQRVPITLLQCTSEYPVRLDQTGIDLMSEFEERFGCDAGFSDHSGSVLTSVFALGRGAKFVEVHVTFSKLMRGPDASSSVSFEDLSLLVNARDHFETLGRNYLDKNAKARELKRTRELFGRSLVLKVPLEAGEALELENLELKKPGGGLREGDTDLIVGKRAVRPLPANRVLRREDFGE